MLDTQVKFTPAVLVTGQDEKGNEFTWWKADGKYVDAYNEREITDVEFRAIYPQVEKVYFSDTVMTGDQWRDIQCPLSMSTEQLDQWRENIQYVEFTDGFADERIDNGLYDDLPYRPAKLDDGLDDSIIGALP